MTKPFLTILGILLFLVNHAVAQSDSVQNREVLWHKVEAYTPTIVALPDNFDSTKAHTLVIGLYGFGGTAEGFQGLSKPFTDAGFIFATPEAVYDYMHRDGTLGHEWFLYDISTYIMLERDATPLEIAAMRTTTENQMGQVIDDLKEKYKVDKVIVSGMSQGGIITYLTGIHHHDKVDGIVIFSSVVDEPWLGNDNVRDGNHVRALVIQGTTDKAVPIELAEQSRDLLIDNGFDVTYKTFEGGHRISMELMPFVIDWINEE